MGKDNKVLTEIKNVAVVSAVIVFIPILLTVIYNIPSFDFASIAVESVLEYFGVCLGLVGSVYIYTKNRQEELRAEKQARKPRLCLDVKKRGESHYEATVSNVGTQVVSDVFLFDNYIFSHLNPRSQKTVLLTRDKSLSNEKTLFLDGEFCGWSKEGEYPETIILYVFDERNKQWMCEFTHSTDGGRHPYFGETHEADE